MGDDSALIQEYDRAWKSSRRELRERDRRNREAKKVGTGR